LIDPRVDIEPIKGASNPAPDWSAKLGNTNESAKPPLALPEKAVEEAPTKTALNKGAGTPLELSDSIESEEVADRRHNRDLREKYSDKAYKLATGCLTMWTVMLGTQGAIKALAGVEMWSDKVIIAVTTGVTVSVLAAFLGVIRGLFGNGALNGKENKPKN
jgi:hypothetical protein